MKRIILGLVIGIVLGVVGLFGLDSSPAFAMSGNGTAIDPYIVTNISEFQDINLDLTANYTLMNNIDASITNTWNGGAGFISIGGDAGVPIGIFDGRINGNGYYVYNLYINNTLPQFLRWNVAPFYIIGNNGSVTNLNFYNTEIIGSDIAGFVFENFGNISDCSFNGTLWDLYTQSLAGFVYTNRGNINKCFAEGSVNSNNIGCGFTQVNYGSIINSYSTCDVTGGGSTATGFCAWNIGGTITNCYFAGNITGGLEYCQAGFNCNDYAPAISSCYWDINISGVLTSAGGTGKTTTEMKQQATFIGWDFSGVWDITEGVSYPTLIFFCSYSPFPIAVSSTYVSMTSARLNGFLSNDAGVDCNVSFIYEEVGTGIYYGTTVQTGKRTGDIFYADIGGLTLGTSYNFTAVAVNTVTGCTNYSSWLNFTTISTIGDPSALTAIPTSTTMLLNWIKGNGSQYTEIRYKANGWPLNVTDGNVACSTTESSFLQTGLIPGTTYYYRAWAKAGTYYALNYSQVLATTSAGAVTTGTSISNVSTAGWFMSPSTAHLTLLPGYQVVNDMADAIDMPYATWWFLLSMGFCIVMGLFVWSRTENLFLAMIVVITCGVLLSNLGTIPMWTMFVFAISGLGFSWREIR